MQKLRLVEFRYVHRNPLDLIFCWAIVGCLIQLPLIPAVQGGACLTAVDKCGSLCLCQDVTARFDTELGPCQFCMAESERGCFCSEGEAWLDDKRAECVTFQECRTRTPGSAPVETLPHRERPSSPIERPLVGDQDMAPKPPSTGSAESGGPIPGGDQVEDSSEHPAGGSTKEDSEVPEMTSDGVDDIPESPKRDPLTGEDQSEDDAAGDVNFPVDPINSDLEPISQLIDPNENKEEGGGTESELKSDGNEDYDEAETNSMPEEAALHARTTKSADQTLEKRSNGKWFDQWFAGGSVKRVKRTHSQANIISKRKQSLKRGAKSMTD